jgi:hypothetical protein
LKKEKKIKIFKFRKLLSFPPILFHQWKLSQQYLVVILGNLNFVQTSKTVFHQLIHQWIHSKQWLVVVRAFSAILSAKGCDSILHRVFSYPVEIFSSSIGVTITL